MIRVDDSFCASSSVRACVVGVLLGACSLSVSPLEPDPRSTARPVRVLPPRLPTPDPIETCALLPVDDFIATSSAVSARLASPSDLIAQTRLASSVISMD